MGLSSKSAELRPFANHVFRRSIGDWQESSQLLLVSGKFVAREAARELLQADGAADKVLPLLQRLVLPLRMALMAADREVFSFGLDVLKTLSELLGMHLNQYLHLLLQQLGKKLSDRLLRDKVFEVLTVLEEQGGEEVQPLIKAKIPTYRT